MLAYRIASATPYTLSTGHLHYRRIFHEADLSNPTLSMHGRFYAPVQGFSRSERRTIKIDGECTVELDISSCHPRLLLHSTGHEAPLDAYAFPGSDPALRRVYKQAVLILLNAESRRAALGAFSAWVTAEKKAGALPKKLVATRIFEQVEQSYPEDVRRHFYSDTAGRMTNLDSRICAGVLRRSVAAGIPVLAIHDGFVTKVRHEAEMYQMIQDSYAEVMGAGRSAVLKRTDHLGDERHVDAHYYGLAKQLGGRE